MPILKKTLATANFRGMFGGQMVFREWGGDIIVSAAPVARGRRRTKGEKRTQLNFTVAAKYANAIKIDPDQSCYEGYAVATKPRQTVHNRAMQDFLSLPTVDSIDMTRYHGNVGDKIIIRAQDDFRVTHVDVKVCSADDELLEEGLATQNINGLDWTYVITCENEVLIGTKFIATAHDVPTHTGSLAAIYR